MKSLECGGLDAALVFRAWKLDLIEGIPKRRRDRRTPKRPAGYQAPDTPLVQIAMAADARLGIQSKLASGSTDSNIPLSLGVPSVTIDGGGGGPEHIRSTNISIRPTATSAHNAPC